MSEDYNSNDFIPTIDAILSVADLDKVSVKRIRKAIQELFGQDLQPYKKDVNQRILERYHKLLDDRKNKKSSLKRSRELAENEDKIMYHNLSGKSKKPATTKVRQKRKTTHTSTANNAFFQEQILSPELADVVGESVLPRTQVVKALWGYIKNENLQDPDDKRVIICDDKLKKVFDQERVGAFEMNKFLSSHLTKKENSVDNSTPVDSEPITPSNIDKNSPQEKE